ncbi:uncharacterized protein TNCV_3241831 [Trichonephila clavipes]|nr:uncharacterized protein TNCV_3241831 [Trichonephila clavipes]
MSSSTFTWHVLLTKVFLQSAGNRHVYESSNLCWLVQHPLPDCSATSACWWKGKRGGRPLNIPRVLPLNWGGIEPNSTGTCMVLIATADDRRHLALCHDEFRGPRSGLYRSGGVGNNNDRG